MFRCEVKGCDRVTPPRQPVNKIITETRQRFYEKVHKRGKLKGTVETIKGSEIVREIDSCPQCFLRITGQQPKEYIPPPPPVIEEEEIERPKKRRRKKKWINPKGRLNKFRKQVEKEPKKKPVVQVVNKLQVVKETTKGTGSGKKAAKSGKSKNRNRRSKPSKKD
jgi:hypothetical protein